MRTELNLKRGFQKTTVLAVIGTFLFNSAFIDLAVAKSISPYQSFSLRPSATRKQLAEQKSFLKKLFDRRKHKPSSENIAIFTITDYGKKEINAERRLIKALEKMGLSIYREPDTEKQPKFIDDSNPRIVYKFLDSFSDKEHITLFLTGGYLGGCILIAFKLAVFYALFKKDIPIHIVLVEEALAEGVEKAPAVRQDCIKFIKEFPINSIVYFNGVEGTRKQLYLDRGFAVSVSFYTKVGKFKRRYPKTTYYMEADNHRVIKKLLKWCEVPEKDLKNALEKVNEKLMDVTFINGTEQPDAIASLIKIITDNNILRHITSLDDLLMVIERIGDIMKGESFYQGRAITVLDQLITQKAVSENIRCLDDLFTIIERVGNATVKAEYFQTTAIASLADLISLEPVPEHILSLTGLLAVIQKAIDATGERESPYLCEALTSLTKLISLDAVSKHIRNLDDLFTVMEKVGNFTEKAEGWGRGVLPALINILADSIISEGIADFSDLLLALKCLENRIGEKRGVFVYDTLRSIDRSSVVSYIAENKSATPLTPENVVVTAIDISA